MNKQIFISNLKQKLSILNATEINDILIEYSGYIDDAMSDGKSEEEAIKDFGNIDELAQEILSAYKINTKHAYRGRSTGEKIDDFVKDLASIMGEIVNYFLDFFQRILKDYDVDNFVQILVLIIVGLVIIAISSIPFWIIRLLGHLIISIIIPIHFISKILIFIWGLIVGIVQLILSVLIIISLIRSGMQKKDVSESLQDVFKFDNYGKYFKDFKNNMNKDNHSESKTAFSNKKKVNAASENNEIIECEVVDNSIILKNKENEVSSTINEIIDVEESNKESKIIEEEIKKSTHDKKNESIVEEARREYRKSRNQDYDFDLDDDIDEKKHATKKERNFLYSVLHLCYLLIAGIISLSTLPIYVAITVLCIILAFGVYLASSGVQIIGCLVFIFGIIVLLSTIADIILKFVGFSKAKFKSILLSFIASVVLLSGGSIYGFIELNSFEYPVEFTENNVTLAQTFPKDTEFENNYYNQLAKGISASGHDINVTITYDSNLISNVEFFKNNNNKISIRYDRLNRAKSLYTCLEYIVDGLKNGIIYTIKDINIMFSE